MGTVSHFIDQRLCLRLGTAAGKEYLISHAPVDNRRMVSVHTDHSLQRIHTALLKSRLILGILWIRILMPVSSTHHRISILACASAHTPEVTLAPEQDSQFITGFRIGWIMGIMRTTDKVHPALLDHGHIPIKAFICDRIRKACVILMGIGTVQKCFLPIQIKPVLFILRPAETQRRLIGIHTNAIADDRCIHGIQIRILHTPQMNVFHLLTDRIKIGEFTCFQCPLF